MNAGFRTIQVTDPRLRLRFPLHVYYPSPAAEEVETLGPYPMSLAWDAPMAEGPFPLVMISHGSGGTPLVYRDLARALARAGYVVALPEHPFNNRSNNAWQGKPENLVHRPRHLRLAADGLVGDGALAPHVKSNGYAVIGHSMGGYTALALAGGRPRALPDESPDGIPVAIDVTPDPRVGALVLLAPALVWFWDARALDAVRAPILMLTGERDEQIPPEHAVAFMKSLDRDVPFTHRTVPRAGHFAFISPFPPAMTKPTFPPSQDPPGFDRAVFQRRLAEEILAFLDRDF